MKRILILLLLIIVLASAGIVYLSFTIIPIETAIVEKDVSITSQDESVK